MGDLIVGLWNVGDIDDWLWGIWVVNVDMVLVEGEGDIKCKVWDMSCSDGR